ncbi:MAG: hypothetical protein SF051_07825 [Elusimicrobiota bacterium]|nr:hypothetical protein [Elusimicrobiota bacterium]
MRAALAAALLAVSAGPAVAACSPQRPSHVGNTQGYSADYGDKCFVSIHPMNAMNLVYRDYTFFDTGLLMVFSSYGPGEDVATLTSAREYYLFPRLDAPRLEMDAAAGTVSVLASDGRRFRFDPATAQVAALDGDATVAPVVDPSVRGGFEITRYAGLLLDAGYRRGGQPSGRRNGDSTFRSPHGQFCTVKNHEVFEYTPDGEHRLKYDDAALKAWLATRCPALSVPY